MSVPSLPNLSKTVVTPAKLVVMVKFEKLPVLKAVSTPAPPTSVSSPPLPCKTLLPASPVNLSLYTDPTTFSMLLIWSLPAAPVARPVKRSTTTAPSALLYSTQSLPAPPSRVSSPNRPSSRLSAALHVMESLRSEPSTPSILISVSVVPNPSCATPVARLTSTPVVGDL